MLFVCLCHGMLYNKQDHKTEIGVEKEYVSAVVKFFFKTMKQTKNDISSHIMPYDIFESLE